MAPQIPSSGASQVSRTSSIFSSSNASQSSSKSRKSFRPSETAKNLFEVFTGISDQVAQRRAQFADLARRCDRLGVTLEKGSHSWKSDTLKEAGNGAQKTLEQVWVECQDWQKRWYGHTLASDALIDKDLDKWGRDIMLALEECTITMLSEIVIGNQSIRILTEDTTYDNVKALAKANATLVQPKLREIMDKAYEELRSQDTELSPLEKEELVRDLRGILTTDNPPASVHLQGELTTEPTPLIVKNSSDIFKGVWITVIRGIPYRKEVAVKRLRDTNPNPVRARRFMYEGALWRMLAHDNVVPFYGIHIQADSVIGLVSQWAQGGDAMTYLRQFPHCNRRAIVKGAAHGIAYLHRCEVVHGSIFGSNILIDETGKAMVSDFGLAAATNADGELITAGMSTSQTMTMARWMAPELTWSNLPVPVFASDVFMFARTILEIMTGDKPFPKEKNTFKLITDLGMGRLKETQPEDPEVRERGLTDGVWALLTDMWKKEKEARPTMSDVEARLDRLM